ncbi:MAG: xylulokinase [Phycisphaerales bacterium]|nr:xylulokinase [Phycisphaerales bacterium]
MAAYLLGIDVGTGGSKALLIDETGHVAAAVTTEYPLHTPKPLWSEQNPHDWYDATVKSIRAVLAEANASGDDVVGMGLTGQMHGLVLLDEHGDVLRPAILWNDQRTAAQCDEIHQRVGLERVLAITGKPALTGFTASKVLWVREQERDVFDRAAHLLLPKDYVRYRLTGELKSDVADASGTMLFDVGARRWSDEMIEALDVPRAWLPEVTESPVVSATLSTEAASATGLPGGLPVVAGAGDQAAEAVGCGIVGPGQVSVTIGTSGVVFAAMERYAPPLENGLHAYCHAIPDQWHVMGVMLSAGGSLRWYRDELGREETAQAQQAERDPYEILLEDAAHAPPGCEGLVFLPYLAGERTPYADPHARGAFVGLTLRHTKAHLTRAVVEGVTFGLLDCLNLARRAGLRFETVRISGGGARSLFWRQLLADVFQCRVATVNVTQGAAYGAALLAGVGGGLFPNVAAACHDTIRESTIAQPTLAEPVYRELHRVYRGLYQSLKPRFVELAETAAE